MTNHPLTDEMCEKLQLHIFSQTDADCMRAAADWQLEQVIEWLGKYETIGLEEHDLVVCLIHNLKEAMRPQEDDSAPHQRRHQTTIHPI